jgi:hypothetical protein
MPRRRLSAGAALAMALGAMALVSMLVVVVAMRFDGLYGADSIAYFTYSTGPLRDSLLAGQPPPPFFWPPGYPVLVALTSLVMGMRPVSGQVVAMLAAAVVPILTWSFTRAFLAPVRGPGQARRIAVYAAVITALTGQLWQSGIVVMADTAGLAFACLSATALARYVETGRRSVLCWSAAALTLALVTRWGFALLAMPWVLCVLVSGPARRALRDGAAAAIVGAALLAPMAVLVATLDSPPGLTVPSYAGDLAAYSWNPVNAFRTEFETGDGHLAYERTNGWYYLAVPVHWYYLTPLLVPAVVLGIAAIVRAGTWPAGAVLIGWPLVFYAFHAGAPWQNFRFPLAYLPPLAALAGLGVDVAMRWLTPGRRPLLAAAFAAVLVLKAGAAFWLCYTFVERKNVTVELVRQVESGLPDDAVLLTFNYTDVFRYYGRLDVRELFTQSSASVDALASGPRPVYLLVDPPDLQSQWRDKPPGRIYRALLEADRLEELGARGGLTLFLVTAPDDPADRVAR